MHSKTVPDGCEVALVVGFFDDDIGAIIESGEGPDGIREFDDRGFGEFYRLKMKVVDDQGLLFAVGFGIHTGDEGIADQDG